jgi:hypothetical protein
MSEETHVIYHYPDQMIESIKIEKNTKGYNWEIKAATVERVFELDEQVRQQVAKRDTAGGA